jgi:hypothetical protein
VALLDLSLVTETLVKLVDESIKVSPAWPMGQIANVTSLPPDRLEGDNTLGLYLYHLTEDAAYKNQTWAGRPQPPMRFSPMGLSLFYVLSGFSGLADSLGPYREQLMMGLAIKALHDWPIIDEGTVINGVSILHPNLRDSANRLRLELRHVPVNEAVSFWTAGAHPLRLSAYYEARVIMLAPDEPETGGGRIFKYAIQTFVSGPPRLETSRNQITFQLPGESTPRVVEMQPAVAPQGSEIAFFGVDLTGDIVGLSIRASSWSDAVPLDALWSVVASADRIYTTVQSTVAGRVVLPGAYTAVARVTKNFAQLDGTTRAIEQVSNQTPFTIAPLVSDISVPVAGGFTVTGGTFQDPDLDPAAVVIYLGATRLANGAAGSLGSGQFAITSPTTIEMSFPSDATPGSSLLVRIVVNGAESLPRWVDVS